MSVISLKIEVESGATPSKVIRECSELARKLQVKVRFTHNTVDSFVDWTDTEEKALNRFEKRKERKLATENYE